MSEINLCGDIPNDAIVSVTVKALRSLYYQGFSDGGWEDDSAEPTVDVESGFYRFPAIAASDGFSRLDQFGKLIEEVSEVESARRTLSLADDFCDDRDEIEMYRTAYGMELMDVIHAAETALRMEFSENEVDNLKIATIVKNIKRGYYEWDDR